ncbi:hypothetical protein SHYC_05015 [Staphylococcus hyicus]|nr:hypothetical protein SHYC_05015 [Staphylococcus hyicus]SQE47259.1 Uncharacterised protein [Staphylococcus hyicus]
MFILEWYQIIALACGCGFLGALTSKELRNKLF